MWNGSRFGPRGGMPFRGEPKGEMFEGRDGPMPGFRGREGMNMGPNMGPGLQNRPLMDMRRFDGPPDMMGRNMGPLGRGRDPPRNFFSSGNEPDHFQRRFDMEFRNNQQNAPGFMGQGRAPMEMGGRDMQGRNMRGSEAQFMDMRERDRLRMDMPGMNMSPMDIRRRFAMEAMDRNENLRERERPEIGMNDIDGFSMDVPSRERPAMDFERRGFVPPLNPRGRFESDMDFRNRIGSSEDFRERSPQMLRDNDGAPMRSARGRPDLSLDCRDPEKLMINPTLRDREFPDPDETPEQFREEKSLSEDWHKRGVQDRESPSAMKNRDSSFPREIKEHFLPARGGDGLLGEPPQFKERNRSPSQLPLGGAIAQNWDKKVPPEFPSRNPPHAFQKPPLLPLDPPLKTPSRDGDGKLWPRGRDEKPDSIIQNIRHPFIPEKSQSNQEPPFSLDHENFKGSKDMPQDQGPKKGLLPVPRERQDQDYRDIDYRTSSGRKFDYPLGDLQGPEKNLKETKFTPPERTNNSGSKDQDYRSAGVQDKVSNTIAVSGIPKTATMQQILDAFAVHDGAPVQGMKIKNVVPGYSYDTAYVEFLNLEDAVHFMESNQGSVKVGSKVALLKYIEPDKNGKKEQPPEPPPKAGPPIQDGLLPTPVLPKPPLVKEDVGVKPLAEPLSQGAWQRNSNLTPEAWQQQVDKQLQQQEAEKQSEEWAKERAARQNLQLADPVFKESKTMIIKNVLPTTTVETILKTLDPFAYLDERNVRLVKGKSPGSKCFCFVDMDSHEHVVRLVELLTKPRPIIVDGVRVYAEVAKPLKNQSYRKDFDKSSTSLLGYPPDVMEQQQQQQQYFPQPAHTPMGPSSTRQDPVPGVGANPTLASTSLQSTSIPQGVMFSDAAAVDHLVQPAQHDTAGVPGPALTAPTDGSEAYNYSSDAPDLSAFLYDATSGFYYDPQTTLYYDPNSRYFYNAQTQQYLYWDATAKTYVPVDGSTLEGNVPAMQTCAPVEVAAEPVLVAPAAVPVADEMKTASEGAPERKEDEEAAPRSDKKEKEERPKSLAAFKIMKDMERWAKIQNRQKESVRSPSPVLKSGAEDKKASKAADAAFAVFERKGTLGEDLFKKPLAPLKKEEKSSKRSMGSLGLLAADYAAGSDEEEEEKHEVPSALPSTAKSQPQGEEKEDKLTDWKKMACLLCRRQFPNKDALIRHQQLSDLHKQNMEIHLKIKKSKRELEALENQEKEMTVKESSGQPEAKKRKQQNTWGNSSRDANKGSDRPGLGLETTERKKKEPVVWNYSTYKQAVRKAMFARFKELE